MPGNEASRRAGSDSDWFELRIAIGLLAALAIHGWLLWGIRSASFEPPEFGVESGESAVEVTLVAAPPAKADEPPAEESLAEPEPPRVLKPEMSVPAETPTPMAIPEPTVATPSPDPEAPKKPVSKPARKQAAGDGSAAKPGKDRTTQRAGSGQAGAPARYLRNPAPAYPEEARRAGIEGTAYLRVSIDARGRVQSVRLSRSSGHRILDDRALATVRARWRFKPALRNGVPVSSQAIVPIRFVLQ